jgi:hypothetical protein
LLPRLSFTTGLGHPIKSLSDVRGADARRAGIRRPNGVTLSFQVSLYKVEPSEAVRARYLLTKDEARTALSDEMEPGGP